MGMDLVFAEFVSAARRAGLRLSPVEAIDAQRAAMAVGVERRGDLKDALRAVLVKDAEQLQTFERAFEAFFRADGRGQGNLFDRLRSQGFTEDEVRALTEMLEQLAHTQEGDSSIASIVSGGGALDRLLALAGKSAHLDLMQSPMQVGFYTQRMLESAGMPRAQTDLLAIRGRLRDALGDRGDALADAVAAELENFRGLARSHVHEEFKRRNGSLYENLRRQQLDERSFATLRPDEIDQITLEVKRLAERLKGALAIRRRRQRRGHLDVRRTLRAAHRTGGLPFVPAFRRRRRERPKLVLLCDVSDSVRSVARFLLIFAYAVQEAFSRTRSFVFVSDLGETTELFKEHSVEHAIQLAYGGSIISVAANSNYGCAFGMFEDLHRDVVDHHTTVVVIGDGRNNYNDPNPSALAAIQRRAGRVLWMNPEPPGAWGFGDSAMRIYEPFTTRVMTVHNLETLRDAVDALID